MTVKKKTPPVAKNPTESNGQEGQEVNTITLSAIQLDKFTAVQQKELAFQNEIVAIRAQKTDLLEVPHGLERQVSPARSLKRSFHGALSILKGALPLS